MFSHRATGLLAAAVLTLSSGAMAQSQSVVTPGGAPTPGELKESDPVLQDGSFYRCHRLNVRRGQVVQVIMASTDFDAFLMVGKGPS